MFERIAIEIEGISPILFHRYAGEKPSADKPPKGKKTESWIEQNRKSKWMEAAYHDGEKWAVPPENVEALIVKAAAKIRKGTDARAFVAIVEDSVPLWIPDSRGSWKIADGPLRDYYVPHHIDIRGVVIGKARVDACRPIFRQWMLRFTINYDSTEFTADQIRTIMDHASVIGLGDFRPRFGRFKINVFEPGRSKKAA